MSEWGSQIVKVEPVPVVEPELGGMVSNVEPRVPLPPDIDKAIKDGKARRIQPGFETVPEADFTVAGQFLVGRLTEVKPATGKMKAPLYLVKRQDGVTVGVWGSAVLDRMMKDVKPGMSVMIQYAGTEPTDKGSPMKMWEVVYGA